MTEKKPKPAPKTASKTEMPDAIETTRLFEVSGGTTGAPSDNKDLSDEEMRNTSGG